MTIKEQGSAKFGRLIQQNIDQAHYLAKLVDEAPELELAKPVSLNVVCFRYVRPGVNDAILDELNKQIEIELQERGIAVPSIVSIRGRKYLHVCCDKSSQLPRRLRCPDARSGQHGKGARRADERLSLAGDIRTCVAAGKPRPWQLSGTRSAG